MSLHSSQIPVTLLAKSIGVASPFQPRTVLLVSPDASLRSRLRDFLIAMRWKVQEASGGAEAMGLLDQTPHEAMLLDGWLPDLEINEFAKWVTAHSPDLDVLYLDGTPGAAGKKSPRRNELTHVLRQMEETVTPDSAAWQSAPEKLPAVFLEHQKSSAELVLSEPQVETAVKEPVCLLPGMVGASEAMREMARMVRLVAPRYATVLIEGETGTGKELVAQALHRLGERSAKPLIVLNCAAIPEALLEAELFGHTRGAFTGAVQSRTGRIEAANGGTLFLDEIGEMPLALQAKMLRFLECGELQKIGENETLRVDVRVIAATHQPLERHAAEGKFRLDLYHRLAVFPVEIPALRDRMDDLSMLVEHLLRSIGERSCAKRLSSAAMEVLRLHQWPGNVRELAHVLERGAILAEQRPIIEAAEIRIRARAIAS